MPNHVWFTTMTEELAYMAKRNQEPYIPHGHRVQTQKGLERLLLNAHDLSQHLLLLGRLFTPYRCPYAESLTTEMQEAVLQRGFDAMEDDDLAELVINPVSLLELYSFIEYNQSEYWINLKKQLQASKPRRRSRKRNSAKKG